MSLQEVLMWKELLMLSTMNYLMILKFIHTGVAVLPVPEKAEFALLFVTAVESFKIRQLEKMVNAQFHKLDIPSGKDVCRKQFFYFMDKLINADISHGDYETYMPDLQKKFADISKEEVLKRVAALEFDHFLKYYENENISRM